MHSTQKDFNNSPAGIALATAIGAVVSYRSITKDPQKVLRARKRSPLVVAAALVVTTAMRAAAQRSDDPQLRKAASEAGLPTGRTALTGALTSAAGLVTAKALIGDRTEVSARRALAYVALTAGYGVASRVYNRAALLSVQAAREAAENEGLRQEMEELTKEVLNKDSKDSNS